MKEPLRQFWKLFATKLILLEHYRCRNMIIMIQPVLFVHSLEILQNITSKFNLVKQQNLKEKFPRPNLNVDSQNNQPGKKGIKIHPYNFRRERCLPDASNDLHVPSGANMDILLNCTAVLGLIHTDVPPTTAASHRPVLRAWQAWSNANKLDEHAVSTT